MSKFWSTFMESKLLEIFVTGRFKGKGEVVGQEAELVPGLP